MGSFLGFWWRAIKIAGGKAWCHYDDLNNIASIVQLVSFVAVVAAWIARKQRRESVNFWLLAVPVGVFVIVFLYHLAKAPHQIYKDLYSKMEVGIAAKEQVASELQAIKDAKPQLQLRPAFSDRDTDGKSFCRIGVKNQSGIGTAKLVKVELIKIVPDPELLASTVLKGDVPYPITLNASEPDGATIHPRCVSKFDVFAVNRTLARRQNGSAFIYVSVNLVARRHPESLEFQLGGFSPEYVDKDNPASGFKEYSITIRASAEGVCAVVKTFSVFFVTDVSQDPVQLSGAPDDLSEAGLWHSFGDIPDDICRRLLRSRTSLLDGLKKVKRAENEKQ